MSYGGASSTKLSAYDLLNMNLIRVNPPELDLHTTQDAETSSASGALGIGGQ